MINTTPQLYPLEVKVGTRRYLVLGWTNSTPSEPIVVPSWTPTDSLEPKVLRLKNEGSARFSLPTQDMDVTLTDSSVSVDFMEPLEVVGGDSKKRPVSVVRLD